MGKDKGLMDLHIPQIWIGFCMGNIFCVVVSIAIWKILVRWSDGLKEKKNNKRA